MKHFGLVSLLGTIVIAEVAIAQTLDVSIPIVRQNGETYEKMLGRAETLAQSTINQRFKQNKSLKILKVIMVGESQGTIAPLLSVEITRKAWEKSPNIQNWATTFPFSKTLLGFDILNPQGSPTRANTPNPAPTTASDNKPPSEPSKKPSSSLLPDALPLGDVESEQPQQPLPNQRLGLPSRNSPNN